MSYLCWRVCESDPSHQLLHNDLRIKNFTHDICGSRARIKMESMYIDLSTSKLQIQFYSQPELLHCNGTHLAPPQDFLHDRKTKELLFFFPWPSPLPMGSQSDCKDVLKQTAWKLAWGPGLLGQDWIPIKDLTRLNSLKPG